MSTTIRPVVRFHVCEERGGEAFARPGYNWTSQEIAQGYADQYNADEQERALMERRSVQVRYFVAKATTTFEEVSLRQAVMGPSGHDGPG